MYIYSKKNKKKILGVIYRYSKISKQRLNISPINEYLQVSTQKLKKNLLINPHIHKKNKRTITSTQEIWLVFRGKLSMNIFDIDSALQNQEIMIATLRVEVFKSSSRAKSEVWINTLETRSRSPYQSAFRVQNNSLAEGRSFAESCWTTPRL